MTINPYTLNMLYQKGILDFVPQDLMAPTPVGNTIVQNPYLNIAAQGNLYKQYGAEGDRFASYGNGNSQIGSQSNNSIGNMFGFNGTGSQSSAGTSMFGDPDIGEKSNVNIENTCGGFTDVKNSISGGFNKVSSVYSSTPNVLKGLAAAGIILMTVYGMFKFGMKNPSTSTGTSFWSKLNPMNWFKNKNIIKTS